MNGERVGKSLRAKLVAAQALVIVAGSTTLALVALAVGPPIFRDHVREALGIVPDDVAQHLDQAFFDAVLIALAVAVATAAITAGAMSWYLAGRIARPIRQLSHAARGVAEGHYGERVPVTGSDELAVLAASFNEMAQALESLERRRRELLADLGHELRTPLATIDGYLEGIADGVVDADPETVALLRAEAARLRRLVEDVATVSRAEERQLDLRPRPVDAAALVGEAAAAVRPAFEAKGVELRLRADERLPTVSADPDRLSEVLRNLLDNALRHTPPRGVVTASAATSERGVALAVEDTGEGIDAEHLPRLFERFYRADRGRTRAGGGSGIGLTIARAIVEAHGGTLRAESGGRGQGTRFVAELPVRADAVVHT